MLLFDVLEHTALLEPLPVEHRLAGVLGQAHLLEPLNKVAAKKTVSHGGLPTSDIKHRIHFLNTTQQVIAQYFRVDCKWSHALNFVKSANTHRINITSYPDATGDQQHV